MIDPTASQAVSLTTAQWMIVLAAIVFVIQFLYRLWDKKDNKEILSSISSVVSHFDEHVERTKDSRSLLKDLHKMHHAVDEDGRPLVYMPKELLETQREIVKLTHTVATTQKHMARLFEKFESTISSNASRMEAALIQHSETCKNQFHELDKTLGSKK